VTIQIYLGLESDTNWEHAYRLSEKPCALTFNINLLKPSGNFTRFNIKKFYVVPTLLLCVLYGSQNKQQLLPYKTLTDRFLQPKRRVFTARYALSPYIKQIRFVFKGLINKQIHFYGKQH
jgi:hypothetical protein